MIEVERRREKFPIYASHDTFCAPRCEAPPTESNNSVARDEEENYFYLLNHAMRHRRMSNTSRNSLMKKMKDKKIEKLTSIKINLRNK